MCEADGVPPPRYSWYKDGEPIISSGSRVTIAANGSLLIQSVAREDAGMYNCVVESDCDESEIFSPNASLKVRGTYVCMYVCMYVYVHLLVCNEP